MNNIEDLRTEWTELYASTLPAKARQHDPAQQKWPVNLDHCFGRIILDNVVGDGKRPWTQVLASPAVKKMDEKQLQRCIELGKKILNGEVNLVELDRTSLVARGKSEKKYKDTKGSQEREPAVMGRKRKANVAEQNTMSKYFESNKRQKELSFVSTEPVVKSSDPISPPDKDTLQLLLQKIASDKKLTPYRKRLYSTLLSVPRGRYTTYAAMSDYLESSARAVGNGMRNNPFAPDVPCHRVLAADGSIGGFGGDWGKEGKHASKKLDLLREEGVKFDSRGKVYGQPFRKLQDLSHG